VREYCIRPIQSVHYKANTLLPFSQLTGDETTDRHADRAEPAHHALDNSALADARRSSQEQTKPVGHEIRY